MKEFIHNAFKNKIVIFSVLIFLFYKLGFISKYSAGRLQMERIYRKTKKHLYKKYYKEISQIDFSKKQSANNRLDVWIFWFQGFDNAPEIVNRCVKSARNFESENWDVHLLDKNNLHQFVHLPAKIERLFESGKVTMASFSDLIRLDLLSEYGGLWIDSTCFINKKIPSFVFEKTMFVFKSGYDDQEIPNFQSWFMYSEKGNPIILETLHILCSEVIKNKGFNHYFYFFFVFQFITTYCHDYWDSLANINDLNSYYLQQNIGKVSQKDIIDNLNLLSFTQKVTYKNLSNERKKEILDVMDLILDKSNGN